MKASASPSYGIIVVPGATVSTRRACSGVIEPGDLRDRHHAARDLGGGGRGVHDERRSPVGRHHVVVGEPVVAAAQQPLERGLGLIGVDVPPILSEKRYLRQRHAVTDQEDRVPRGPGLRAARVRRGASALDGALAGAEPRRGLACGPQRTCEQQDSRTEQRRIRPTIHDRPRDPEACPLRSAASGPGATARIRARTCGRALAGPRAPHALRRGRAGVHGLRFGRLFAARAPRALA